MWLGLGQVLLQQHVGISSTKTKRVHPGSQGLTGGCLQGMLVKHQLQVQPGKVDIGIGCAQMQRRRQRLVFQGQHRFDETGHARSRLHMAQVGLDRADRQRLAAPLAIDGTDGGRLDRIANGGARAMGFDEIHVICRQATFGQHVTHQVDLPGTAGDGDAGFARAIGIYPGGTNDGVDFIAIGLRLSKGFKQQHSAAFGAYIPVAGSIERLATSIGG